jgi:hypothetical protein
MPNVQGSCGAVVADVADHRAVAAQTIETGNVGALVDVATLFERLEKIRLVFAHGSCSGFDQGAVALALRLHVSSAQGERKMGREPLKWKG